MISFVTRVQTLGIALTMGAVVALATASVGRADDESYANDYVPPPSFFISFPNANDVGVVDPLTGEIEAVIPFKSAPLQMIVNPVRPIMYIVLDKQIVAYQLKDRLPFGSITLPAQCFSYAINPSGSKIYASSCGSPTVYIANTKTFTITGSIQLPSYVSGIAISNRRHRLYAAMPALHSTATINVDDDQIEQIKYLGQCSRGVCSPGDVVVSPDDRYLISLDQRQCETIEVDLGTGRVVGRTPHQASLHCYIRGVDAFSNELWVEGGFHDAAISMAPPFNQTMSFRYTTNFESVAFSPSGQGFAVGNGPDNRNRNVLVSFPSLLQVTTLWSSPFKVIYVP